MDRLGALCGALLASRRAITNFALLSLEATPGLDQDEKDGAVKATKGADGALPEQHLPGNPWRPPLRCRGSIPWPVPLLRFSLVALA